MMMLRKLSAPFSGAGEVAAVIEACIPDAAMASRLAALHETTFGRPRSPDYYHWQYTRCPGESRLIVARAGERIVGTIGIRRRQMASAITCGQIMDMIVTPDARGSGVFRDMILTADALMPDIQFSFAHANVAGRNALIKSAEFKTIGQVAVLILARADASEISRAARDGDIRSVLGADTRMEAGLERFSMGPAEYAWRFAGHPEYQYRHLLDGAFGPILIKEFQESGDKVVDMMTPFAGEELEEILDLVMLGEPDWSRLHFWSASHLSSYKAARQLGFGYQQQQRYLVGRANAAAASRLQDFGNWMISASDAEYM